MVSFYSFCLGSFTYLISWQYCTPIYQSRMEGFGIVSDPIEPPWVAFTVILGPLRHIFGYPMQLLLGFGSWAWGLFWYLLENDSDDSIGSASSVKVGAVTSAARKALHSIVDGDLSMDADEYI